MTVAKKRGRPKRSTKTATERIAFRVTEREFNAATASAQRKSQKLGEFARDALMNACDWVPEKKLKS